MNIEKRYAYAIFGLLIIIAGIIAVNALAPGEIPNPGHSISEVGAPSTCLQNQYLQWTGTAWQCQTPTGESYKIISVNKMGDITNAGGSVSYTWAQLGISDIATIKSEGYSYVSATVSNMGETSGNGRTYTSSYLTGVSATGVTVYVRGSGDGYIYNGLNFQFIFSKDSNSVRMITCPTSGACSTISGNI